MIPYNDDHEVSIENKEMPGNGVHVVLASWKANAGNDSMPKSKLAQFFYMISYNGNF
jgi:hypothetical protein